VFVFSIASKGAASEATTPEKNVLSSLVFRQFSTPLCYPEKMAGTVNLIRTCNIQSESRDACRHSQREEFLNEK